MVADLRALTASLHDPSTYVDGVPYAVLAELRREHGIVRVEEPEQAGWPEGPGYWLVLRHADVSRVLRDPRRSPPGSAPPRCVTPPRRRTWPTCGG